MAKNQEPRTKNQEPRTKNQEPRTKNQEPRTKNQEPRTKNQEPSKSILSPGKLKKKRLGTVIIEVCITLPIVVYLIFFCLELMRINIVQNALLSICEEATYLTIAHDYTTGPELIEKVDAIIEKYRPSFVPKTAPGYTSTPYPVIRYWFTVYNDLDDILSQVPYGGECVTWPGYEHNEVGAEHASPAYVEPTEYIPVLNWQYNIPSMKWQTGRGMLKEKGPTEGCVFVLTFSCNYPFSSAMVKMLFNGGTNSKVVGCMSGTNQESTSHKKGSRYILWARGAGMVGRQMSSN